MTKKYINWGAGPRASTFLILAAKAKSILANKPTPDNCMKPDVGIPCHNIWNNQTRRKGVVFDNRK